MDFTDTPEEAVFREQARTWLSVHSPLKSEAGDSNTLGSDRAAQLPEARKWLAEKAAAGFVGITWPKAYGGRELPPIMQVIYDQEEANYSTPSAIFRIGLGMCIPTLMRYASEEQKQHYIPKAMSGEHVWCQLFSEPVAGSDVAGIRTRADRDGDDWIINGQKVWTTGAHFADYGLIVTRSDFNEVKHKGLTCFFLDMKSAGIEAKPIRQISGTSNFNEVFFTDVRVPDSQRLGEIGEGWKVALTTLMNERLAVGEEPVPNFDQVFALVRETMLEDGPALENAAVRERLADWYVRQQGLHNTRFRTITALSRGQTPGPEMSIAKVITASKLQEIASFGLDLQELAGMMLEPEQSPMQALFQDAYLYAPGFRIAGGTDEILRNIIAERVLGLPADIRVDKDLPFNELSKQ